jgi:hypothetical protein
MNQRMSRKIGGVGLIEEASYGAKNIRATVPE